MSAIATNIKTMIGVMSANSTRLCPRDRFARVPFVPTGPFLTARAAATGPRRDMKGL
jgi:hypothetical protein